MYSFAAGVDPFQPPSWLRGAHIQTLITNLVRRDSSMGFHRQRLETDDGDFIDLDFPQIAWAQLPADAPLVLVLHGLEGSARRGYACETYKQLAFWGIRSVGMNFRSCSGELNRTPRFYHAGATDDVRFVYHHLDQAYGDVSKGLIGFSLGGNMLLKLLGEWGSQAPATLRAAAAISPPFDMVVNSQKFKTFPGTIYGTRFLRHLAKKVAGKRQMLQGLIDVDAVIHSKTLVDFDENGTAPLHGFAGAQDYYRRTSSAQFLPSIERPTLLIRAQDDPLMDAADIPLQLIDEHPHLTGLFPPFGGHVGFFSGRSPANLQYWGEAQAAKFLVRHLKPGL